MILERTAEEVEYLGEIRGAAYKRSLAQASKMKGNEDQSYNFKYQINDWVKRRNFRKMKFQNSWSGPYYVVEYGFPGTYKLMKPDGTMVPNLVNECHLLPWNQREDEDELSIFEELEVLDTHELGRNEEDENEDSFISDTQDYAPLEEDSDNSGLSRGYRLTHS